jgi:ATP-dependent RNA helicase DeaD
MNRGHLNLQGLKALVLDEADTMLNMGFKEDVDQLLAETKAQARETP